MKKLTALLAACSVALCAVSCGQKSGNSTPDGNTATTAGQTMPVPGEAEKVIRDFAESSINGDVDTMILCMYPAEMIDAMEKAGMKEDFVKALENNVGGKLKSFTTDSWKELSPEAVSKAKSFFEAFAIGLNTSTQEFGINEGYSFNMNIDVEADGQVSTFSDPLCTVSIEGGGWKIIPASEEDLLAMGQAQTTSEAQPAPQN